MYLCKLWRPHEIFFISDSRYLSNFSILLLSSHSLSWVVWPWRSLHVQEWIPGDGRERWFCHGEAGRGLGKISCCIWQATAVGGSHPLVVCIHLEEKAMAPHSSTLAWKTPWAEESGVLQSMGSRRVGHDWATSLSLFTFMHWRRKWQPTPVFLPGESQGQRSLVGCCLWGRTESDRTEVT